MESADFPDEFGQTGRALGSSVFSAAFPSTLTLSPPIHIEAPRFHPVFHMHTTHAPAKILCCELTCARAPSLSESEIAQVLKIAQVLEICDGLLKSSKSAAPGAAGLARLRRHAVLAM